MMDVSPNQLVSVAASLIPFLEHDDANRALMGSNMQRQAVPLLRTRGAARRHRHGGAWSRATPASRSSPSAAASVESVDADAHRRSSRTTRRRARGADVDIINLIKYRRSNQNTCINQKPIVKVGQRVRKGAGDRRRPRHRPRRARARPQRARRLHALGRLQLRGLDPDLASASSRTTSSPRSTSRSSRCVARDTKLGKEEITRDIPNVGEEALKDLDESGIVRIGAEVQPDDILVGKITPKGETQLSPEEKLLRAIFGEKAGDVRDTSLRVPPGIEGIVIGAKVFSRRGVDKDERARAIEDAGDRASSARTRRTRSASCARAR